MEGADIYNYKIYIYNVYIITGSFRYWLSPRLSGDHNRGRNLLEFRIFHHARSRPTRRLTRRLARRSTRACDPHIVTRRGPQRPAPVEKLSVEKLIVEKLVVESFPTTPPSARRAANRNADAQHARSIAFAMQ